MLTRFRAGVGRVAWIGSSNAWFSSVELSDLILVEKSTRIKKDTEGMPDNEVQQLQMEESRTLHTRAIVTMWIFAT